jgi:hypothetical protein
MTVRLVPENLTRPASITPALTSSSLYFPISARSCSVGSLPASESLVAFTITMNLIVVSSGILGWGRPCGLYKHVE